MAAKRKGLGDPWPKSHTGAEAVAAATGSLPPEQFTGDGGPLVATSYRVTKVQFDALRDEAHSRSKVQGGKADASAVLREILAGWMLKGSK